MSASADDRPSGPLSSAAQAALEAVHVAFADAPRPTDPELLHPDAGDDGDIVALYTRDRWQDVPDATIEGEYAALFFLSAGGFRWYLPACLSWVLRHPDSGAAVEGATLMALTPPLDEPLRSFGRSKFVLLDDGQREAVRGALKAMHASDEVEGALGHWA
ncbi:MAG: DUF6714 family protein [Candidatus Limnocylindrales bacterium]|jgi:hypothetical protein